MARILTSSMTCNAYTIDMNSWIENYDKVYASKFSDLVDFSDWLSGHLEYVLSHIPGSPCDIIDEEIVSAYADAIIEKLGKPKGIFSKELIDQLNYYGSGWAK